MELPCFWGMQSHGIERVRREEKEGNYSKGQSDDLLSSCLFLILCRQMRVSIQWQQHSVATVTLGGKDPPRQRRGCRQFHMNAVYTGITVSLWRNECITVFFGCLFS